MGYVNDALDDVRAQIAANDDALAEARNRRDLILKLAGSFRGALRTFGSGSLAHGTINDPVTDADCGLVLDRTVHTTLGPESDSKDPPSDIVAEVREFLGPKVRAEYPDAVLRITKRAIKIEFHAPLANGQDPTADLVVALNRRDDPGLWIPNTEQDRWDPSHPEKHVELLRQGGESVARTRRRVVRLAKAWNKQFSEPGLCSFNITALAWECIEKGHSTGTGLQALFHHAASELHDHLTEDPAGVSKPIKLPIDRETVVGRLRRAAELMDEALNAEDDEQARDALQKLFWKYELPEPCASGDTAAKRALAEVLRGLTPKPSPAAPTILIPALGREVKQVRSHGGHAFRVGGQSRASGRWYLDAARRSSFQRGRRCAYPTVRGRKEVAKDRTIWTYEGTLVVPNYPDRVVRIQFGFADDPETPRITADGPTESRHRFDDGSLCIWFAHDPEALRWVWRDGLVSLLDLVVVHLFKEAWWRETTEWLGPEVHRAA